MEFATLRRELEHYEAREIERNSESAARRSASPRRQNIVSTSDDRAGNFRIYTPSPTSASLARTPGRTLQSPITLLSQPEQRDFILEDGYDALDPHYWMGPQLGPQGGATTEARGSVDPTPHVPTTNPWSGTPFQTLPRTDTHS